MTFSRLSDKIDKELNEYLDNLSDIQEPLYSAMKYSVISGGKRLRPVMAILTSSMGRADDKNIIELAIAIELIHCYSLVHDDLPSMDNDELRRGKPTTHIVYGQGMAILAGDGLLNQAFEILTKLSLVSSSFAKASNYISVQAGIRGMIAGQCIDISNQDTNADAIINMYKLKTSCLFKAALAGGAIAAGCSDEIVNICEKIGECLGISFQIADDLLEITSTTEQIGKNVGSDKVNNKITLVNAIGYEEALRIKQQYDNDVIKLIDQLSIKSEMTEIYEMLVNRKK